jgi:hypothetical protein
VAHSKEGFDDVERGDYKILNTDKEIDSFFKEVREEVAAELVFERKPDKAR